MKISSLLLLAIFKKYLHADANGYRFMYIIGTTKSYTKNKKNPNTKPTNSNKINIGSNNQKLKLARSFAKNDSIKGLNNINTNNICRIPKINFKAKNETPSLCCFPKLRLTLKFLFNNPSINTNVNTLFKYEKNNDTKYIIKIPIAAKNPY